MCLSEIQLERVKKVYSKIKGDKITNHFHLTVGNEKSTNLPNDKFDKVILNMVLHHFTFQTEMLADIKKIIKKDGKLFVMEAIIPQDKLSKFPCNYYSNQKQLLELVEQNGFELQNKEEVFSGSGTWAFIFGVKK